VEQAVTVQEAAAAAPAADAAAPAGEQTHSAPPSRAVTVRTSTVRAVAAAAAAASLCGGRAKASAQKAAAAPAAASKRPRPDETAPAADGASQVLWRQPERTGPAGSSLVLDTNVDNFFFGDGPTEQQKALPGSSGAPAPAVAGARTPPAKKANAEAKAEPSKSESAAQPNKVEAAPAAAGLVGTSAVPEAAAQPSASSAGTFGLGGAVDQRPAEEACASKSALGDSRLPEDTGNGPDGGVDTFSVGASFGFAGRGGVGRGGRPAADRLSPMSPWFLAAGTPSFAKKHQRPTWLNHALAHGVTRAASSAPASRPSVFAHGTAPSPVTDVEWLHHGGGQATMEKGESGEPAAPAAARDGDDASEVLEAECAAQRKFQASLIASLLDQSH